MSKRSKIDKIKQPIANTKADAEINARMNPTTQALPKDNPSLQADYDYQQNMGEKDPSASSGGEDQNSNIFFEHGISGLTRFGGFVYEEWLKELQGRKGALTYREMRDNDAIIGAFLYSIEMLIRQVKWKVIAAGDTTQDIEAKEFVESCFDDMSTSWNDTISEILTFLPYGWAYMETVYKKRVGPDEPTGQTRSKFSDGRIGWRKWGIRAQETLWRWRFDSDGSILGMEQIAPPDYLMRYIPIDKALLFRTKSNKNNPEGRSLLRNVYRSWYFKKNIEEVEAIGIERDLAGLPVMWLPPEVMAGANPGAAPEAAQAYNAYKKIAINIKRDEQEGILMPLVYDDDGNKMYDLQLLSSGSSRRQFDTNQIIQRYEQRIAMTVLADWLMLGHEKTGSYALSTNKTTMFQNSLLSILDIIADVINTHAIPRLMKLNTFSGLTGYPKLGHADIERANLKELGDFLKNMAEAGGIELGDLETENYLREAANLPKKNVETTVAAVDIEDDIDTPPESDMQVEGLFNKKTGGDKGGKKQKETIASTKGQREKTVDPSKEDT